MSTEDNEIVRRIERAMRAVAPPLTKTTVNSFIINTNVAEACGPPRFGNYESAYGYAVLLVAQALGPMCPTSRAVELIARWIRNEPHWTRACVAVNMPITSDRSYVAALLMVEAIRTNPTPFIAVSRWPDRLVAHSGNFRNGTVILEFVDSAA